MMIKLISKQRVCNFSLFLLGPGQFMRAGTFCKPALSFIILEIKLHQKKV